MTDRAIRLAAAGAAGGVMTAVADLLITGTIGDGGFRWRILPYSLALCTLAGCAAGAGLGVLELLSASRGPALLRRFPMGLALAALLIGLNAGLFDGPWIRSRPWGTTARTVWLATVAAAGFAAPAGVARSFLAGARAKALAMAASIGLAVMAAVLNLQMFGAYPAVKWQLVLLTWGSLSMASALLVSLTRRAWRRSPVVVGLLLAVAGALVVGVVERRGSTIAAIRAGLVGLPFPATSRVLIAVEEAVFDRIAPLGDLAPREPLKEVELDPRWDPEAVRQLLDERVPDRRDMNVVWVAFDALRADHVGCLGYSRRTTPHLDALADSASLFSRAVAPIPASAMGYSCALTGLFARVSAAYGAEFSVPMPVPADLPLPELLRRSGWRTAAVTAFYAAVAAQPNFKTHRAGFEIFESDEKGVEPTAREVVDRGLTLADAFAGGRERFFLWLHFMEPHAPYSFHPEYEFGRRPIDAYDAEIAEADAQLGRLVEGLRSRRLWEKTILVIFGDHGEGFGEHNNREHGGSLHDHQVRVPLLIRVPGLPARKITHWVGLQDLPRTMLTLLDIPDRHPRLGRDLGPLITGTAVDWPDWTYAERAASAVRKPRSWERGIWSGDLKLLWKPHHATVEVYDLARDPRELENLADLARPEHRRLWDILGVLDRRIDSWWGDQSLSDETGRTPGERLHRLLALLDRATDDAARVRALEEIRDMFLLVGAARVGREGSDALIDHFFAWIPAISGSTRVRELGLLILTYLEDPRLPAFLRQELDRETDLGRRLSLAVALARRGDSGVRPDLDRILREGPVSARIRAACGLALLGSDEGRPWLLAALSHSGTAEVLHAVDGLAALGDEEPLRRIVSSSRAVWTAPTVAARALDLAVASRSCWATAALLLYATNPESSISDRAREALGARSGPDALTRARSVIEAIDGARSAILYHDASLAVRFFEPLLAQAEDPAGAWWWVALRAACDSGNRAVAVQAAARLRAACGGEPWTTELVQRVEGCLDQIPAIRDDAVPVTAALTGDWVMPFLWPSHLLRTAISVENRSDRWLPGGEWATHLRFRWTFHDESGAPADPAAPIDAYLPWEGLASGAKVDVHLLGRLPPKRGSYRAKLVLVEGAGATERTHVLLETPPIPVN